MPDGNENPISSASRPSLGERIARWMQPRKEPRRRQKWMHVIANPAAGQDQPVLKTLNTAFKEADVDWDIFITKAYGDGKRLAREAVAVGADVVVVFGGDGTVVDVASGLVGTSTPLGILPGGTANMMSRAMGIPQDLKAAAELIANPDHSLHKVFIGQVGEAYFAQMVGIGTEARIVEGADRTAKNHFGNWAYTIAALKALADPTQAHYRLEMDDGQVVEEDGVTCLIAKTGNLGISPLEQSPHTADPNAPLMDIVIVRKADVPTLVDIATTVRTGGINPETMPHWQARQVTVTCHPPEAITADGELLGKTPVSLRILPDPVTIIVPPETVTRNEKNEEKNDENKLA
ncbi:MAG: diacylglycerol kinase family lipid kinase [Anaerolineaceae bacterium]|nr:diacylglycerol kinase family lipid kinase [Anaerolineaceae bacterium]